MKKLIALLLVVVMCTCLLSGCMDQIADLFGENEKEITTDRADRDEGVNDPFFGGDKNVGIDEDDAEEEPDYEVVKIDADEYMTVYSKRILGYDYIEDTDVDFADALEDFDGAENIAGACYYGGYAHYGEYMDEVRVMCISFYNEDAANDGFYEMVDVLEEENGCSFELTFSDTREKAVYKASAEENPINIKVLRQNNLLIVVVVDWELYREIGATYHDTPMIIMDEIEF